MLNTRKNAQPKWGNENEKNNNPGRLKKFLEFNMSLNGNRVIHLAEF